MGNSWVITNIVACLKQWLGLGSVFAPRDFPQHIAPGSTGIVSKSRMSEAFHDLKIEMVIRFLGTLNSVIELDKTGLESLTLRQRWSFNS